MIALERSLLTDAVRSDRATVAALLHPQWQEIGPSGRLWTREEILTRSARSAPRPPSTWSSSRRLSPDPILLLWRSITDDGSVLRSSLWQRTGGRWQQRFHQGTREA